MEKTFEFPIEDLIPVQPEIEGGEGEGEGGGGEGEGEGGGGEGEGKGEGKGEITDEEWDKIQKEIEDALSGKGDNNEEDLKNEQQARSRAKQGSSSTNTQRSKFIKAEEVIPKFSWQELIQQFVMTQSSIDTTYQKMSRRGISGIAAAAQTGAGAIVPGEKVDEEGFKLLFVFDTSASMSGIVEQSLSEAKNLIKKNFNNVQGNVAVLFFSDTASYHVADLTGDRSWPVKDFKDINNPPANSAIKPLDTVFSMKKTGATNFNKVMINEISRVIVQGYNVIIFSDEDIIDKNNWPNFLELYNKHRLNIFLIVDDLSTFNVIVNKLGDNPSTFGVLNNATKKSFRK